MVERSPEEAGVGGSIPSRGTEHSEMQGARTLLCVREKLKTAAMCTQRSAPRGAACGFTERRRGKTCRQFPPAAQVPQECSGRGIPQLLAGRSDKWWPWCSSNTAVCGTAVTGANPVGHPEGDFVSRELPFVFYSSHSQEVLTFYEWSVPQKPLVQWG